MQKNKNKKTKTKKNKQDLAPYLGQNDSFKQYIQIKTDPQSKFSLINENYKWLIYNCK